MQCIKCIYVYDQSIKDWLLLVWTMFCYVMIVRSHPVEYQAEGVLLLRTSGRPVCFEGRQALTELIGLH